MAGSIPKTISVLFVTTEYPAGFILLCFILGAGYAAILYFTDLRKRSKPILNWSLALLRLLSVFLISFLLLSPLFRRANRILIKPSVVIGIDNSESMILTHDSSFCVNQLPGILDNLTQDLEGKFDVKVYSFGTRVSSGFKPIFKDQETDLSMFMDEFINRYSNLNAAAVVLITDGIYNQGLDPFYAAQKITFPIYTVAIGDTTVKKDGVVRNVRVNKVVYKNDQFTAEAIIDLIGYQGSTAKLRLSQGSKTLEMRETMAPSANSTRKIPFILNAKEKGFYKYSLFLDYMPGEENRDNNRFDFYVEVREARKQIALVSNMTHPDINAMKSALDGTANYEVNILTSDEYRSSGKENDLVILYQLPSITGINDLSGLSSSNVPLLCILGTQTYINGFNNLNAGFLINGFKNSFSDASPVINENFSLFTLNKNDFQVFANYPPLLSPFGLYQNSPTAEVLFYQKISGISTATPLILVSRTPLRKTGIIAGENFWRWRISSYSHTRSHESFDIFFEKMVNYLTVKKEQELFKVSVKNRIRESEPVELEAEVRNASNELINDMDVELNIMDSTNHSYPFIFGKTQKSYYLNAGIFPPGIYRYSAVVKVGPDIRKSFGEFIVGRNILERMNLVAEHGLLSRISESHDAEMVNKSEISSLADKIKNRPDLRTVFYNEVRMKDLLGNPLLFAVIMALLTVEWILRKRDGR